MVSPSDVKRLTESTDRHILTLYFNTRSDQQRSAYPARLRSLLHGIEAAVPAEDRKLYDQAAAKLMNFVSQYQPAGNSLLVFAGPKSWDEFPSRIPVRDEASWGLPNTAQLLWLIEEYRPYGVLVAGIEHVRFLSVRLNEFEVFKEFRADIDTSQWRKQVVGSKGGGDSVQKGGRSVEAFDQRYMEQVRRFWKTLHKPLAELVERYRIRRLVLAGTKSVLPDFAKSLPPDIGNLVVTQMNMETFTNPTDAVHKVLPAIAAWEQQREHALVAELFGAAGISKKAAVGVDPVLKFVQDGRASRLIVAKDFDAEVSRCAQCKTISASTNSHCGKCSAADMTKVSLAAVLPRLVIDHGLPIEVVKGDAAKELTRSGGVGAFLRF
ncbi:MAG TPA: VLRF1 family aeRF1-type release factor [bacterium]|nr:VLRF1 family aeRF1-type release factor [bacterium]